MIYTMEADNSITTFASAKEATAAMGGEYEQFGSAKLAKLAANQPGNRLTGIWNSLQGAAFDLSGVLPTDSILGSVLAGLLGFNPTPSWGEVIVYLAVIIGAGYLFLRPLPKLAPTARRATPTV